jgi:hypothetical protein
VLYGKVTDYSPDGALQDLASLKSQPVPADKKFGSENVADLILARSGIFDYDQSDLDKMQVCPKHATKLGLGWTDIRTNRPPKGASGLKCNVPDIDWTEKISHSTR